MDSTYSSQKSNLIERISELSSEMEPLDTGEVPVLKSLSAIKAVVFDFYGTMFISGTGDTIVESPKANRKKAFQEAFDQLFPGSGFSKAAVGVEFYQKTIHLHKENLKKQGIGFPEVDILEVWRDVLAGLRNDGADFIPEDPEQEFLQRLTIEFEMRDNPTWPMPDLYETLETLYERNFLLGILSNSQFYTPLIFESHFGSPPDKDQFDVNICIWSFEEQLCKPSLSFHKRLKRALEDHHNITTDEVLFVGNDMFKDIYPAAHFGFRTALFAGDERSLKWRKDDDRCKNLVPDIVVTRLYQIVDCIGKA